MAQNIDIGNVVKEYMIGNTTIKICDDAYRDKAPEEIEEVLERVKQKAWECIRAARAAGKDV